jgi:hypothetical protein
MNEFLYKINNWFRRNIRQRNLIKKNEQGVSYVQILGFLLIGLGILYMSFFLLPGNKASGEGMSISFFITMLGVSFAFPSLLEGNEGLSTMRIVVFMVTNVICMLLLKIGWNDKIDSLKEIGLDEWWMGVIAFVFGAKAAQSFFESKMASIKDPNINGIIDQQIQYKQNALKNMSPTTTIGKMEMTKLKSEIEVLQKMKTK